MSRTTDDKISYLMHNLKSSITNGLYSIPPKILKISKEIMSLIFSQLINDSFSKGKFPNICKLAPIIRIFQNNFRLFFDNYRSISLLQNISNIFVLLRQPKVVCHNQWV